MYPTTVQEPESSTIENDIDDTFCGANLDPTESCEPLLSVIRDLALQLIRSPPLMHVPVSSSDKPNQNTEFASLDPLWSARVNVGGTIILHDAKQISVYMHASL